MSIPADASLSSSLVVPLKVAPLPEAELLNPIPSVDVSPILKPLLTAYRACTNSSGVPDKRKQYNILIADFQNAGDAAIAKCLA